MGQLGHSQECGVSYKESIATVDRVTHYALHIILNKQMMNNNEILLSLVRESGVQFTASTFNHNVLITFNTDTCLVRVFQLNDENNTLIELLGKFGEI